jgi:hypothetical protein
MININEIIKNFWSKGATPVVLFSGSLATGTITLTQSWRPFRRIYILYTTDDNGIGGVEEHDVAAIKYAYDNKALFTSSGFRIISDHERYWYINVATMTDTSWPVWQENCVIKRILGVY